MFRFSLRMMLLTVTLFSVWLGIVASRANRQKRAAAMVREHEGYVWYDYMCNEDGIDTVSRFREPSGPKWLRDFIGLDYFATVYYVSRFPADSDSIQALDDLPSLRHLVLVGTGVTDSTLDHIDRLTQLKELDLWNTQVSDEGLKHVEGLTQLERISLYEDTITDIGLQHLKGLTHLKYLHVGHTKITAHGVQELKRVFPDLEIDGRSNSDQ